MGKVKPVEVVTGGRESRGGAAASLGPARMLDVLGLLIPTEEVWQEQSRARS